MRAITILNFFIIGSLAVLASGCIETLSSPTVVRSDVQQQKGYAYNGKRARVAVATVGWQSGDAGYTESYDMEGSGNLDFMPQYTHSQYSNGLTEQLINSLLSTKRYRILEKEQLPLILSEMDLHNINNTQGDGLIDGADLLVVATITGWSPGESGTSGRLSGLVDRKVSNIFDSVSGGVKKSRMAMNIRVVDIRSREIIGGTEIRSQANDVKLGTALRGVGDWTGMDGELETFANTSMEKAIRVAVIEAANFVIENTPQQYYNF